MIRVMTWWQMAIVDGIIYSGIIAITLGTIVTVKQIKNAKRKKVSSNESEDK